ncbi:MAG: P-loop containing nucleoside triphosphate hydrolase protein [Benniella sp.]|nr:MAG: P-loop containing nucleoside triphosphate hydrolase protein [Benniella sp.]
MSTCNIGALSKRQETTSFEDMGLNHELLHSIHEFGFEVPTRLQRDALPRLLKGCDVVIDAPVNSGKTTTACISVLQHISASNLQCQALILTTSFEAAFLTLKIVLALGSFSIQCHICTDKTHLLADKMRLSKGSQIIIGTPDCSQEFIQQGVLMTNNIRMFVLDRVDDMFAEGYGDFIEDIFQSIPRGAQVVFLLSKAFPGLEILTTIMRNPVFISHDVQEPKLDDLQTSKWSGRILEEVSWEFGTSSWPHPIERDPWGSVPKSPSTCPVEKRPLESVKGSCPTSPIEVKPQESIPLPSPAHPPEKKKKKILKAVSSSLALPVKQEAGGAKSKSSSTCPAKEESLESVPSSWPTPVQEKISKKEFKQDDVYDNFADMGLKSELLRGIIAYGLNHPSTTQRCATGAILKTQDVIVQTPSGADKTEEAATYCIPILQKLDVSNKECQALILAPSPERARQIQAVILALGTIMNVKCFSCGSTATKDATDLKEGSQIITGTPGRVLGTITYTNLKVSNIKMFVVDQSDGELAEKAWVSMYALFQLIPHKPQVVIFSSIVLKPTTSKRSFGPFKIMDDPLYVDVKKVATSKSAPIHNVAKGRLLLEDFKQFYVAVKNEERKLDVLINLCQSILAARIVVFYHDRKKVGWLKKRLIANNLRASAIHGDMPQGQRDSIIKAFSSGSLHILISTDLLLHNTDVGYVSLVINYDLPAKKENYHHRIVVVDGCGHKGVAINLVRKGEMPKLKEIEKLYSTQISETSVKGPALLE